MTKQGGRHQMQIIQKMAEKQKDNWGKSGVTIGFLGDSVTQGCFELYEKDNGALETYFDQSSTYHGYVAKILSTLYPSVPVNILNAGISGGNATQGAERIEKDLICHKPDMVVVCFGLNDAMNGLSGLGSYTTALKEIFAALKEAEIETIFLTPNMMNTDISCHLEKELFRNAARNTEKIQNEGVMDAYMEAAMEVCRQMGVTVCDCYGKWKKMAEGGVVISNLLANHINHPLRKMNWLFAVSLVETMFEC